MTYRLRHAALASRIYRKGHKEHKSSASMCPSWLQKWPGRCSVILTQRTATPWCRKGASLNARSMARWLAMHIALVYYLRFYLTEQQYGNSPLSSELLQVFCQVTCSRRMHVLQAYDTALQAHRDHADCRLRLLYVSDSWPGWITRRCSQARHTVHIHPTSTHTTCTSICTSTPSKTSTQIYSRILCKYSVSYWRGE